MAAAIEAARRAVPQCRGSTASEGQPLSETPRPIREWRGVDPARFAAEIRPLGEPAVLRGLAADWPAVQAGRAGADALRAYLRRFCADIPAPMFEAPPQAGGRFFSNSSLDGFNFERRRAPVRAILDRLAELEGAENPPAVYAGSLSLPIYLPGFAAENGLGDMVRADPLIQSIWIGGRTRIAPHYDQTENVACVVGGRRRFLLFPMDQVANLYVGPLDVTPAGQPVSLVDPAAPDFERYPRYRDALTAAQVAELEPGDAIYIPTLWWHGVEATADFNVLVNYWWRDAPGWMDSPAGALLHAALSLKGLPEGERLRWRSLFDYLIFQPGGRALEHLPREAQGLFGELTPETAAQIRAFLAKGLTR